MDILEIPVDKISRAVPEQTDEYKEQVARLVSSIKEQGLFHPLTVRPANEDGTYLLASGNKRLDALVQLGETTVPCVLRALEVGEPPEITHIHENLKRYNLPWYEQVELERKLHTLRIDEHGQGRPGKKSGWSLRDTAAELDMSFGVLSEDIRIAEVVEIDPTLKKVADKKTARQIVLSRLKQLNQEEMAESATPEGLEINCVYAGSAERVLEGFPDNTFQACITDPPWLKFKNKKYVKDEFTLSVFGQVHRVLASHAFLIMFVSLDDFFIYREELPKLGFQVQQTANFWIKEGYATRGKRSWEYERDYEPILVAVKGSPALTASMLSAIISCKIVPPARMIHPNEKPVEVMKKLIRDCTYDGALVVDPFAGSGAVGEACLELNRRFVLVERDRDHVLAIRRRLKKKSE